LVAQPVSAAAVTRLNAARLTERHDRAGLRLCDPAQNERLALGSCACRSEKLKRQASRTVASAQDVGPRRVIQMVKAAREDKGKHFALRIFFVADQIFLTRPPPLLAAERCI
jgi:hypothetical protein